MAKSDVPTVTNTDSSFFGGWGGFGNAAKGFVDGLLDTAVKYEQYQTQKDISGQGQREVISTPTQAYNQNAAPTDAVQSASMGAFSQQDLIKFGGLAILAVVVLKAVK